MNEGTATPPESTSSSSAPEHRPPMAGQEARLEKVRKVYVGDLEQGERVHTVFCVTRKARNVGRSGKAYLTLVLSDKTGDIDGRIFDGLEQLESSFGTGDYVLVQGDVISFHGKPQILVSGIERLDPEPIDRKEFVPPPPPEAKRSAVQLREAGARVHDPHLKALLQAFFDDPQVMEALERPAGKGGPQAQRGTIAEHLLSLVRLAHRVADHYPMVDRDLLVTGSLLHDVAKAREGDCLDEARLVGPPVMAAQAIHEKAAQIPNFPRALEHHVAHLALSYLGSAEHGASRAPMTLEALLLANITQMDAEVTSWLELMGRDSNEKWTEHSKAYNRHLWKGAIPTARNKAPVETKPRRRNGADRRKSGSPPSATAHGGQDVPGQQEPREQSLPSELVFKPLSEIAPESASSAEPHPPPQAAEGPKLSGS